MWSSISAEAAIGIVVAVVLAHVALFLVCHSSRQLNVLYLLAATYVFISPFSLSDTMSTTTGTALKLIRMYLTLLIVLLAVSSYGVRRLRPAALALGVFWGFYILAALWSPQPPMALLYKSLAACAFLAGVSIAYGTRSITDLTRGLHWLVFSAGLLGLCLLGGAILDPKAAFRLGRLYVFGLNGNIVGMTVAPLIILTSCVVFYERSVLTRMLSTVAMVLLTVVLVYTGSRGALAMTVAGVTIVAALLVRRVGRLLLASAIMGAIVAGVVYYMPTEQLRLGEISFNRRIVWSFGWQQFSQSPLVGQGWVCTPRLTTYNLHNIYVQVLAETGMLGATLFVGGLLYAMYRTAKTFFSVRRCDKALWFGSLPAALLFGILLQGIAESGTLLGSTLTTLFLGTAVGLADRLPELAVQEGWLTLRRAQRRIQLLRARWRRGTSGPELTT